MRLEPVLTGAHCSAGAYRDITEADCIVFDCDGVLVDVSHSYNLTIRRAADHFLRGVAGVPDPAPITIDVIDSFKATGGFNDEVDLTYAYILCIAAAHRARVDQYGLVRAVMEASDHTGIPSMERYLEGVADIEDLRTVLDYPGQGNTSPLRVTFNQIFYGPEIFSELYGIPSPLRGPGLIENDRLLISDSTLSRITGRFGRRMALVTGRGLASARHALSHMLESFDLDNSFFLEDLPRSMAKPNPESLTLAASGLGSSRCLYVGDSVEDMIMAEKVSAAGVPVTFCGITGTCGDPASKLALFEAGTASIALDSVELLPKVLNQDT